MFSVVHQQRAIPRPEIQRGQAVIEREQIVKDVRQQMLGFIGRQFAAARPIARQPFQQAVIERALIAARVVEHGQQPPGAVKAVTFAITRRDHERRPGQVGGDGIGSVRVRNVNGHLCSC